MATLAGTALLQQKRASAQLEVQSVNDELRMALTTLGLRLAGMSAALQASGPLSPTLYSDLYEAQADPSDRNHERALAFMPLVEDTGDLRTRISQLSGAYAELGYPRFGLFPDAPADALFPVTLVEPPASRAGVFGYNLGSNPTRLEAGRRALAQGVMTVSAPVALSQDEDRSRTSFLLLYPVQFAEREPSFGARSALLAAGVTPQRLFNRQINLDERHIIEVTLQVAQTELAITLPQTEQAPRLRVPLLLQATPRAVQVGGVEMPLQASVFYIPGVRDAALPLLAAAAAALIAHLLLLRASAREDNRRTLETALAAREKELSELNRLQARASRLEALGRLVGGVAHDFNNLLSVILGNLELMPEAADDAERDTLRKEAVKGTMRGASLTRKLLTVGRQSQLSPETLDITQVLNDCADMLARLLPATVTLSTSSAAGLWPVRADADGLQDALLNLALNARDAMDGRGKLTIEASNSRVDDEYLDTRTEEDIPPGRYVAISVTDTGHGIDRETLDRVFEPFFTTKHATDGSGLGLSLVLGFCQQSGGTVRLYSEPGVGTTVRMLLPVCESTAPVRAARPGAELANMSPAHILLAEDNDSVAQVLSAQLRNAGHTVTHVETGDKAWQVLQGEGPFDLLITDLVMPGQLQGADLARRAEVAHPGLALLLISGYPQEAAIEGNGVALRHPVLSKPVPAGQLLRVIARLLRDRA